MNFPRRALLIDPLTIVRTGLATIISRTFAETSVEGVGTWSDALAVADCGPWTLIVVEPALPDGDGIELVQRLRKSNRFTPILALSSGSERHLGVAALRAGASGFVKKTASCAEIADALRQLAQGRSHASEELHELVSASRSPFALRTGYEALSAKERAVLRALASGLTPKEVAGRLRVTASSIGTYRARILRKLDLRTTAELIRYVAEHRLDGGSANPFF